MRKVFRNIFTVVSLFFGVAAFGQTYTGLNAEKKVIDNGDGTYTLELETYVTGIQTTTTSVKPVNVVLVIDDSSSMKDEISSGMTKMQAVKNAAKAFVNILAADATKNDVDHKVAIVTFTSSSEKVIDFTSVKSKSSDVLTKINGITVPLIGATNPTEGLKSANNLFGTPSSDAINLVIMFTDGAPGVLEFQCDYAANAITSSFDLKEKGITVYSIGIYDDDTATTNMTNYMQAVSSNYPKAKATGRYIWPFVNSYINFDMGTQADTKYFQRVTGGAAALDDVFSDIATSAVSQSDESRNVDEAEIYDEMTSEFVIPRNADGTIDNSKVTIKVAPVTVVANGTNSDHSKWVFSWGAEQDPITDTHGDIKAEIASKIVSGKTVDYVNVTGFKYQSNYCGPIIVNGEQTGVRGYKLIIRIVITENPESDGGVVSTNSSNSGVYIDGVIVDPKFPVPTAPGRRNITITNNSLQNDDHAIYTITRSDDSSYKLQVMLSKGTPSVTVKAKTATTDGDGNFSPIKYTVTETSWNWTYTNNSKSIAKNVLIITSKSTGDEYSYDDQFDFTNTKRSDVVLKNSEK